MMHSMFYLPKNASPSPITANLEPPLYDIFGTTRFGNLEYDRLRFIVNTSVSSAVSAASQASSKKSDPADDVSLAQTMAAPAPMFSTLLLSQEKDTLNCLMIAFVTTLIFHLFTFESVGLKLGKWDHWSPWPEEP